MASQYRYRYRKNAKYRDVSCPYRIDLKKLISVHPYCFPTTDQIDREASDGWLHLIASLAPVACTLPINFSRRVSAFSRLAEFVYSLSPVCTKFRYECEFFSSVWPKVNDLVREGIRQSLENRSRK